MHDNKLPAIFLPKRYINYIIFSFQGPFGFVWKYGTPKAICWSLIFCPWQNTIWRSPQKIWTHSSQSNMVGAHPILSQWNVPLYSYTWLVVWNMNGLFPTCQVRLVRFYQSCSPPPPPPPPPPPHPPPPPRSPGPSVHCRTSTATSRSQWALPDLNRDFQVAVGTAGPQPRLPGRSGHCQTSTASSRSQWALPDLNRELQIAVGTAGPQPRLPDRSGHCRTSTATSRSQWALPDLNGKNVRKDVR